MVSRKTIPVHVADDLRIEQSLFYTEGAEKLLVILPGRGYLCSHPILHYLTMMALHRGCDVLQVGYSFQVMPNVSFASTQPAQEVDAAIRAVVTDQYKSICIAGKSMGTPIAVSVIQDIAAVDKRLLLLTPIGNATDFIGDVPSLAIIGTADAAYDPSKIVADHPFLKWSVYEGLNHGLEYQSDWLKSAEVLPRIIADCERFLS